MNTDHLKQLALDANPGPWADNGGYAGVQDSDGNTIANVYGESRKLTIATTEYIIAANPAVILELLREREELLKAAERNKTRFSDDDLAEIHQLAYELGGTEGGGYILDADQLDHVIVKCAERFYTIAKAESAS